MPTVPFIPENAPFRPDQRLWLNGYLAGLCAAVRVPSDVAPALAAPAVPLAILYGSQTGTAEGLAKKIAKEAKSRGWAPEVVAADHFSKVDWKAQTRLLVVTSTYGDGEMPDNARAFWAWLQKDEAAVLAHLEYAVLALGDTNYPEFCAAGKKIDERLAALGAKRLHARAECDADYETRAKEWIGGTFALLGSPAPAAGGMASDEEEEKGWTKTRPFPARLAANRTLTGAGSAKEVRHFEIDLSGSGPDFKYEAGDALGVMPANDPALVGDLLALLGLDKDDALREALRTTYDITKPSPDLLKAAAETNDELRPLLAPERKDDLLKWLWGREAIDVFAATPALRPDAARLRALLKKLAPRLYSISSSPKVHAGSVHLTVGIVRYQSHGRARGGVCSTFLADRAGEGIPVPVFVQTSHGFRLPDDGNVPIVMVGPGTGIAPFRAFLHERQATGARGKNWLFFGDQRAATDFHYREEIEAMRASGHLTRLSTAFSRDQQEKIYVQHRMAEEAAELWAWLQEGARFYVCGDASRMAKDVDDALRAVAEKAGGLSPEAAAAYVEDLRNAGRYQRDVY